MKSINRVTFLGHVVNDPEVRSTKNGKLLCTFALATNNEWLDSDGVLQRSTDFHRIVAWDGLANIVSKNLKKGTPVHLEGRLTHRSYEGKDQMRYFITEVVVNQLFILEWSSKEKTVEAREIASPEKELVAS